jgi:chemotaxis protein methyltransferase WspC
MALAEIELLLKQTAGIDAAAIGSSAIEHAVRERLSACRLSDLPAYRERVLASESELQELIEAVVVAETWFFRDREAFAALARFVFHEWLPAHPEGVLRLLSLPCSTGEEAYSMAMVLLDAGLPANRFSIDAVDISHRALAAARSATYGKNSFRGQELGFRDIHFEKAAHRYRLAEAVRRQVHFQPGNIFDIGLLPGEEIYDVVFCRNLLIYFDQTMQDRAIGVLLRLLTPKGLLFVGPAEAPLLLKHRCVPTKMPLAFSFRKAAAAPRKAKTVKRMPVIRRPATAPSAPAFKSARFDLPLQTGVDLDAAARLADQGRLAEAAKQCENFLRAHGPSEKAYYLLGLVRDSLGRTAEAVGFYRKALYLNPRHHDALLHLALLLEKQGDTNGSRVLNDRAARLEPKAGK